MGFKTGDLVELVGVDSTLFGRGDPICNGVTGEILSKHKLDIYLVELHIDETSEEHPSRYIGGENLKLITNEDGKAEDPESTIKGEGELSVSSTGAEKMLKLSQFSLLPMKAITEVAEHYGKGAKKYSPHNMRKGYEWSKSFDAMMRHATQFWSGEDFDPETGSKHLAAVVFHALTLMEFMDNHKDYDDRYGN